MHRTGFVVALFALTACTAAPHPIPSSASSTPSSSPGVSSNPSWPTVTLDDVAARAAHTATTLADGRVFVAGGCVTDGCSEASAETFLLATDGASATIGPALANPRQGHSATLAVNGDIVLVGGWAGEGASALASVEVFRTASSSITSIADLQQSRGGQAAAALADGRVLRLPNLT